MPRRSSRRAAVGRPHWTVFVIAMLFAMHVIYG